MKLRWSLYFPEGQVDLPAANTGIRLERGAKKVKSTLKDEAQGASEKQSINKETFSLKMCKFSVRTE